MKQNGSGVINEDLFHKAFRYAEHRVGGRDSMDFPNMILVEYKRLLKIEEALQGLADDAQQFNLGY